MSASHPSAQLTVDFTTSSAACTVKKVISSRSPNRVRDPGTTGSARKAPVRSMSLHIAADCAIRAPVHSAPMPTSAHLRSLTLVLPAYNEAKRLGPALDELFGYLDGPTPDGVHPRVDVLVVDDGSIDGTAELVLARAVASRPIQSEEARLELLRVEHAGKGSAVRSVMLAA